MTQTEYRETLARMINTYGEKLIKLAEEIARGDDDHSESEVSTNG